MGYGSYQTVLAELTDFLETYGNGGAAPTLAYLQNMQDTVGTAGVCGVHWGRINTYLLLS